VETAKQTAFFAVNAQLATEEKEKHKDKEKDRKQKRHKYWRGSKRALTTSSFLSPSVLSLRGSELTSDWQLIPHVRSIPQSNIPYKQRSTAF
jgi:hypothetical protein